MHRDIFARSKRKRRMETIRQLKEDIQFYNGLIDLLEVMKNAAVFQFRVLQAKREKFDKLLGAAKGFLRLIGRKASGGPLMAPLSEKRAIIMVTSDEGFVGDLNARVVNTAKVLGGFGDAKLIIVGERGIRYIREAGRDCEHFNGGPDTFARRKLASVLGDYIIEGVKEERFGRVEVVYPKPISFMLHKVEVDEILPLGPAEPESPEEKGDKRSLIIESPLEEIIEYVAARLFKQKLANILEESKLSELAARAIHLEKSTQELTEKKARMRLQYFKVYHEMVDKGTRELFSSQIIIRRRNS